MSKWHEFVDLMTTVHCLEKVHGFQDFSVQFYNQAEGIITNICKELGKDRTLGNVRAISRDMELPTKTQQLFDELKIWLNNQPSFTKYTAI